MEHCRHTPFSALGEDATLLGLLGSDAFSLISDILALSLRALPLAPL